MKESFEFEIAGKTYISKKMTPILRAKLMKVLPLAKFVTLDGKTEDTQANLDIISDILETFPPTMWEFIKDEDKKLVGTYQTFLEELDKNIPMIIEFIQWSAEKIKELNDFLSVKSGAPKV